MSRLVAASVALAFLAAAAAPAQAAPTHVSPKFSGSKVNQGTVSHTTEAGRHVLTLSDDFVVPQTPDPHWRVVDSKGNVWLLDRLPLKDGRVARRVVLPQDVKDVAKVQIWCAFAEVVLGETAFPSPVR
jgi:hypothetical protein